MSLLSGWRPAIAAAFVLSCLCIAPALADVVVHIDKSSQRMSLNVNGQRLATTLAPIGKPSLPTFTYVPAESGTYRGFLPVGQWQAPFEITQVNWQLTEQSGDTAVSTAKADLSPGQDFVKSFVLQPQLTDMSTLSALAR